MPSRQSDRYVPRHRQPSPRRASQAAVKTMFVLSGAAVLGTGAAVAGGSLTLTPQDGGDTLSASSADLSGVSSVLAAPTTASASAAAAADEAEPQPELQPEASPEPAEATTAPVETERRADPLSRSDRRAPADPRKEAALAFDVAGDNAVTRSEDASDEDPRTIAAALVGDAGQFSCLDSLWTKESGWRVDADNPTSSAYGIPQSLPGSKMATFGDDWATNPVTQIRWGLSYIEDRYGSPCSAWSHSQSYNWY